LRFIDAAEIFFQKPKKERRLFHFGNPPSDFLSAHSSMQYFWRDAGVAGGRNSTNRLLNLDQLTTAPT
jgi:hypothetical protein